ncbi:YtpR family tRNA-binding protein [Lacticaseibacillus saniviri]|uniref:EMAP domain-containing protein n=1 Tax=Lacticaseibacillus saniviri JCM 17471 = DSM 24301 TaxID=1293598 RepID=A0A0R2MUW3_9LACO|nr:DUF4479 domain-containing protein [Lacticaseibacillus saniviri]KRO16668.1 EMAP domain-containing protein [Lacticaseibacillus saniviri JCM 17471 = DSM 24301]MCG4282110.1 DUF4479 and tRNA-binding domain-containing protein [Lacticaseibacillus saniviri]
MLITSYNNTALDDTLIAVMAQDTPDQTAQQSGDITAIINGDDQVIGYNFFRVSQWLGDLNVSGGIQLNANQVATLNHAIEEAGLPGQMTVDDTPKFVIGKIVSFDAHPDSDHLHVAKVDVGSETLQIVVGAPNADLGQTVVVALPGAMMPDGKIIWPGALRGVPSSGMMASARELQLKGAPQRRGILLMPDTFKPGEPFDFAKGEAVVAAQEA